MSNFTNSPLVSYVKLSPNFTDNRNHEIDTITIHCVAGNCSVETLGELFSNPKRQASSNYGIGSDGRIAMFVEEADRSWCTSSKSNDNRAVTIEVANITGAPDWMISEKAYASLINLCADICRRNNIKQLLWKADKSLIGQVDKQNVTVHRWFAPAKSCPGNWMYNNMGQIVADANKLISANATLNNPPKTESTEMSNEERLWRFLDAKGLNNFAKAGLMGNIFAESGFRSNNLQNSFEKKLGMNDDQYTQDVDNGSYKNFIKDKAGYGLAQWTYWSRKEALYNYIKGKGKSISDFDSQCEYLWIELQGYTKVISVLKNAKTIREASDIVLKEFEKPADQSNTIQMRRYQYGLDIYNKYVDTVKNDLPYTVKVIATNLRIRKGPGTNYDVVGKANPGVYTIVEESTGQGAKLWGKLKSGAGWIALTSYTQRLS